MKKLKEKLEETTKQHKKEVSDNLRDRAIHIGNLKNISPGDRISVYYGNFYTVPKHVEVHMIDMKHESLYVHLHYNIMRFHMFNCREWGLDDKKPTEKATTRKENWTLADSIGSNYDIIEYPIINVTYKKKMPVSKNHLCCDEKNLTACPYLTWIVTGSYWCTHLGKYLFMGGSWANKFNSKACRIMP